MKNKIILSISLILITLLTNCSSPLEEVEVNNFNLIRASFNLVKNISKDGTVTDFVEVSISDKNYKNFELEGAIITVNGTKMDYQSGFLKNKYYSTIGISLDTEYEFVFTLSSGETQTATLVTPAVNYNSISYLEEVDINKDYHITWNKGSAPVKIKLVLDDTSFGKPSYVFKDSMENDNGTFVIPGNEMQKYDYTQTCFFDLTYIGEVKTTPTKFRSTVTTVEVIYSAKGINIKK